MSEPRENTPDHTDPAQTGVPSAAPEQVAGGGESQTDLSSPPPPSSHPQGTPSERPSTDSDTEEQAALDADVPEPGTDAAF